MVGNRTLERERIEAANMERPFWTVSDRLNLTEPQLRAIEGWIKAPLDPSKALYVASRDGWTCKDFHNLCDGKVRAKSQQRCHDS